MKWTCYLLACGIFLAPSSARAAETARARMYCMSPRFQSSKDQSSLFTLDLSTLSAVGQDNGELAPYFFDFSYTHGCYLDLTDDVNDRFDGWMDLNVPPFSDANGNTYPDFFEVSQAVSATTSGQYYIPGLSSQNPSTVNASWSRSAGYSQGTCVLTLHSTAFGDLLFSPTFELIEYTGPLTYTPGSNTVSGFVNLTQTSNTVNQMQGPVQFTKVSTNRFNLLVLQAGALTNNAMQTLTFTNVSFVTNDLFERFVDWPTNYGGYFDFDDWDPNTSDVDYPTWVLSIDDTNDFNHNAIPDFSDDPPARRPNFSLKVTSSNLLFTIHGDVGHPHQVQESLVLPATNWQTVASVTLTNDPQLVSIALPATRVKYWRVQAQ